jgi:hypothetical protein
MPEVNLLLIVRTSGSVSHKPMSIVASRLILRVLLQVQVMSPAGMTAVSTVEPYCTAERTNIDIKPV